jgi:predicted 3-demethylubiquinone-9 3-methyltransferase (glyoxalase superfamily)
MQKITPFLWFDTQAEEAAAFYTSVFKNSKLGSVMRYDAAAAKATGQAEGSAMTVSFELNGLDFTALNGGPVPGFKFSPATSFSVSCENQEEIDYLWAKLSEGGKPNQCGWLDDKFGVTWQIVAKNMGELIKTPEGMQAMMKMTKIIIADLESAATSK